ncbi:MAG: single-stranded-DNA-specific exonuclease RecJ [Chloroflexia bacterium]
MQPVTSLWSVRPPAPPDELAELSDWPPTFAQLLWNRGLRSRAEAEEFLQPDYRHLADPLQMQGMRPAVERIVRALEAGERITVYGDFDADGVTGVTLLVQALRTLGGQVHPYIPHRIEEGYGLNMEAVERLAAEGTRLLITVDCGISNAAEVARAGALGMDVVITDHHVPPAERPPALAILNPRQPGCAYPFKRLAGVGIAFTLVRGLARLGVPGRERLRREDFLDLVALGTVADVAPLVGENRILVAYGLEAIRRTERPGLRALMAVAGVRPERVGTGTIGFILGPRLNAAGRLRHARSAYHLLLAESQEEAAALARELDALNRERQEVMARVLEQARLQVLALPEERRVIFLASPDFPAGVIGLVAGKLLEEFYRPTLLIELGEGESRGSARSIPNFHITEALQRCADLLTRYGGHRVAAGFSLPNANLPVLEERLLALAASQLDEQALTPRLNIEAEVSLSDLDWGLLRLIEQLAPFGIENPQPLFLCRRVQVRNVRPVGNGGEHLRLTLSDGRSTREAIGFRLGPRAGECPAGRYVDLVCTLERNTWNGEERLELQVRDFRAVS